MRSPPHLPVRYFGIAASLIVFALVFAAGALLAMQVSAGDSLLPKIPAAKGEQCVEPTDVMRRQHMQFILHQRDLTVHEGIRTEKHRFCELHQLPRATA